MVMEIDAPPLCWKKQAASNQPDNDVDWSSDIKGSDELLKDNNEDVEMATIMNSLSPLTAENLLCLAPFPTELHYLMTSSLTYMDKEPPFLSQAFNVVANAANMAGGQGHQSKAALHISTFHNIPQIQEQKESLGKRCDKWGSQIHSTGEVPSISPMYQNKHGQKLDLQFVCISFSHQNFLNTFMELIIREDLAIGFADSKTKIIMEAWATQMYSLKDKLTDIKGQIACLMDSGYNLNLFPFIATVITWVKEYTTQGQISKNTKQETVMELRWYLTTS
ncbi:hypothetical protein L218DRAFT_947785 [Marasmius fiardii PR-910]|nr:hypothetical protein L218DRAFT_947785 [Marasmius fiardii PR-910]